MSLSAICKAARDHLQTTFTLDADSCEIGFDGSPKPAAGELYIGIHPLNWLGKDQDWDLGEEYQVGVTLTMRMGVAPKDRWGIAVWAADDGLDAKARQVIVALHHNQLVRIAADVFITGGASGKIETPLQLLRIELPKLRGPDWFSAAPPESEHAVAECGVSQTIVFGKCVRVQSVPDMD